MKALKITPTAANEDHRQNKMRLVSILDYQRWLDGFLKTGGTITHDYDYPFGRWDWYIAESNHYVTPLYGAESINLIIPEKFDLIGTDFGHNNYFIMKGFACNSIVPIFSDTYPSSIQEIHNGKLKTITSEGIFDKLTA